MKVIYSDHAKKRMEEREIEEWEVKHLLEFPSHIRKSFNDRMIAVGEIGNKKIEIVFIEKENYKKVITVI